MFNFLFSNGDAHWKNFSILETTAGDHRLSPAYDLLNTRMHVDDAFFALEGLLPPHVAKGPMGRQFQRLALQSGIPNAIVEETTATMLQGDETVQTLIAHSFLTERSKKRYWQDYTRRLKRFDRF